MRYEYKLISLNLGLTLGEKKQEKANEILNELGSEGWDMVDFKFAMDSAYCTFVFKRSYDRPLERSFGSQY